LLNLPIDQADPKGLLRAAFAGSQDYPVRDILLAWLMSLAPGIDPAHAALAMLPTGERLPGTIGSELAEIARWPTTRLQSYARTRRRRTR
jgi:hypothetical protein